MRSILLRPLPLTLRAARRWASSSAKPNGQNQDVHPQIELDPSFAAVMGDISASLRDSDKHHAYTPHELEVLHHHPTAQEEAPLEDTERKSPAAVFGSQSIGAVILPHELSDSITKLINASDKSLLHEDAKRLFLKDGGNKERGWDTQFTNEYKSFQQRLRHAERDGTAFASIVLPSHYSAIFSVLQHAQHRLGYDWKVDRVVDWGSGTGSALFAALHTFQKDLTVPFEDITVADSTLTTYIGIDKRVGLADIGKKLLREMKLPPLVDIFFRKGHPYPYLDRVPNTLAITAFSLSALPTDAHRKEVIKEMWASGAETIIVLDHANKEGFASVLAARHGIIELAKKNDDWDDIKVEVSPEAPQQESEPVHIVAPCPHEHECPLLGSKLHCSFSQRIQRPAFVRRTKHSGVGHEDVKYSYVVIRRGPRPATVPLTSTLGREGRLSRIEHAKNNPDTREVVLDNAGEGELAPKADALTIDNDPDLDDKLRQEAYSWPRLVFPPLKNGGHVILDVCANHGKIIRMTVPRSQGKQPYYDARKSQWGDIFPHPPKNAPQERGQYKKKSEDDDGPASMAGNDIGKRKGRFEDDTSGKKADKAAYAALKNELKDKRKVEKGKRKAAAANKASSW